MDLYSARVQISMAPRSKRKIIKWPRYIESIAPENLANRFNELISLPFSSALASVTTLILREAGGGHRVERVKVNDEDSNGFESLLFSIGFDSNMIDRYGVEN